MAKSLTFFVTITPAPTCTPFPIITPGSIIAPIPISLLFEITTGVNSILLFTIGLLTFPFVEIFQFLQVWSKINNYDLINISSIPLSTKPNFGTIFLGIFSPRIYLLMSKSGSLTPAKARIYVVPEKRGLISNG